VIFLHKIVPGGADRSYGIHVAQLAGLPRPSSSAQMRSWPSWKRPPAGGQDQPVAAQQAALFPETNPFLENSRTWTSMPLAMEALNKLFEWQKKFSK